MYVKIETERLVFGRLNQTKLRSNEYIHLRVAIYTEGNAIWKEMVESQFFQKHILEVLDLWMNMQKIKSVNV